jgi:nitroreductase/dihydropteridine reductase
MNILPYLTSRYTTKAFDPQRKLDADQVDQIAQLLRLSPSSTNSQPWHFFIAGTDEGKARIAQATSGFYAFNEAKVRQASHVVVFCTKATIDEAYLQTLLEQEQRDGRFANEQAREGQHKGRSYFVNMHRFELRDAQHWMEKQVYLALGTLLLGASMLEIDACPIEGFDSKILDESLNLRAQGYTSAALVALGYRAKEDFNAQLPKSRLPLERVVSHL